MSTNSPAEKGRETESQAVAELLEQTARVHGAESRAADIVANAVLRRRFRYSPGLGWLEWDGRHWDDTDTAEEKVLESVRRFMDERERHHRTWADRADQRALGIIGDVFGRCTDAELKTDKGKQRPLDEILQKNATDLEQDAYREATAARRTHQQQADMWLNLLSAGKISAVTKLCRGMEGILTRSTWFDADRDLLNCLNGVVDLRDGTLHPHDPDRLMIHLAGGNYRPGTRSALWEKALQAVPTEIRTWYQTRMGQSATGHLPEDDVMIVADGGGENGKTAVLSSILRALGSYARLLSHRVIMADPSQHPTELMDLRGIRLAVLEETAEEGRLDTHRLKQVVGTPEITARKMRRDTITFAATHTLWINTNFLPQVDSTDNGTWRRLKAMPWPYRYLKPGQEAVSSTDRPGDLTLKAKLAENPTVPDAVLAWIVEGARRWYDAERVMPQDPPMIEEATAAWRATSDVAYQFATEYLAPDPDSFITGEVLRAQFLRFLDSQGKHPWTAQLMNTRIPESMKVAGIRLSATPAKAAKVRDRDRQSVPDAADVPFGDMSLTRPDPVPTGKVVRMWRGVRFKSVNERQGSHLTALPTGTDPS